MSYTLEQVLEAAASHPFYSTTLTSPERTLKSFPLVEKYQLHQCIQTAMETDPSFLRSVYLSSTGGTTKTVGSRFFFVTDTVENRRQREKTGQLMRDLGVVDENDIVLNLHSGEALYRSLELIGELVEHARGTSIPIGLNFPKHYTAEVAIQLRPNVITGASSQILAFARYLLSRPELDITFSKVIYTSEILQTYQEDYLRKAFHCDTISSLMGSAEGGIWAAAPPSKTLNTNKSYREFIFRQDMMLVEIVDDNLAPVPEGQVGELVLTSLMRLRNPLVRYRTGDVGSIHPYTNTKDPNTKYQCLRMYGRHPDKSFTVSGEYIDLVEIEGIMAQEKWGVLEWQIVVDSDHVGSKEETVEFRVVLKDAATGKDVLDQLQVELVVVSGGPAITANFIVKPVEYAGLEKGSLASKIRKIVDRRCM